MNIFTFKGGIHPKGNKQVTEELPIRSMPVPDELIIPMIQHTGAPCQPLVKKADRVRKGQKIGDVDAFISAPIHASTSGDVVDVKQCVHPFGASVMSVILKSDKKDEWVEEMRTAQSWEALSPAQITALIREAGMVGLGGAAFPTHVKLSPPPDKHIDMLIINAVECEPYLTADYRLMMEEAEKIAIGVQIIIKALNIRKAWFAIEDNKPNAIALMTRTCAQSDTVRIATLKTKYPQGSEKQLIEAITKRRVPIGKLPLDVGVVVQNVGTAKAVYDAVVERKPLIDRVVTVSGSNIQKPSNVKTLIGTKFSDVIAFCGGTREPVSKIIMGGPMMGIAVPSAEVPVIKGTSGILLMQKSDAAYREPGNCIRCGKCMEVCPMGLSPLNFIESGEGKDYDRAMKDSIMNCMECGSCSYICPARRNMVQWIKLSKLQIQKKTKRKK